jgi:hypothetical protein
MLGIRVTENPLPAEETRIAFIETYARNSGLRLAALSAGRAKSGGKGRQSSSMFEERVYGL